MTRMSSLSSQFKTGITYVNCLGWSVTFPFKRHNTWKFCGDFDGMSRCFCGDFLGIFCRPLGIFVDNITYRSWNSLRPWTVRGGSACVSLSCPSSCDSGTRSWPGVPSVVTFARGPTGSTWWCTCSPHRQARVRPAAVSCRVAVSCGRVVDRIDGPSRPDACCSACCGRSTNWPWTNRLVRSRHQTGWLVRSYCELSAGTNNCYC